MQTSVAEHPSHTSRIAPLPIQRENTLLPKLNPLSLPAYIGALAGVAELVDAADSKSAGPCALGGSSPPLGTSKNSGLRREP